MTTYLGKSCSFCLPRVPFVNCRQFMLVGCVETLRPSQQFFSHVGTESIYVFSYFPFGFEGRIWDLIVSVPDHCLSFYFGLCQNNVWLSFPTVGEFLFSPQADILHQDTISGL